jgi:hypothetical protein
MDVQLAPVEHEFVRRVAGRVEPGDRRRRCVREEEDVQFLLVRLVAGERVPVSMA